MFIQFDGSILDLDALRLELQAAGINALSIRTSRWIRLDLLTREETDPFGRIDIELELAPRHIARARIAALEVVMAGSPHVSRS